MTPSRHVLQIMSRSLLGVIVAVAAMLPWPASAQAPVGIPLPEFQARLTDYLKLRADLGNKLAPLEPTLNGADLTARQAALTAAIRAARQTAKPGDLIPASAARLISMAIVADVEKRGPQAANAIFAEIPPAATIAVNREYPAAAALATMPALLLSSLPQLPESLQYRFLGRNIVILDIDTELIIDYIPDVLPTR